jgi:ActR/RegA family two-component response regulator
MAIATALLVSTDPVTIQQFGQVLQELSISSHVCQDVSSSIRFLNSRKFDAVIIDLRLEKGSAEVLEAVRVSPSNRTAVTFAISENDAEALEAFHRGSRLVFERPLSRQSIRSTLKPAYGLILRERRRYFRCPVSVPVVILRRDHTEVCCYSLNISEGGMAVSTFVPLRAGEDVQIQFTLPEQSLPFLAEAKICWYKTGDLGVRFVSLSSGHKIELQDWLAQKLEEMLPERVAGKFRKAEISDPASGDGAPD